MVENIQKIFEKMMVQVAEFQRKLGITIPDNPDAISQSRMVFRVGHMAEELGEIIDAYGQEQDEQVIDGLVDLAYIAIGTILEHGIDPGEAFSLVHDANMRKERGMTKRGEAVDAVKPEGWMPPDHGPLLERAKILGQVSEVFVDLTEMRIAKGANYNRGTVKRADHFPLGYASYFQMVWIKTIRLRSLVESMSEMGPTDEEYEKTIKLIDRELSDLINYACFWLESIRGLDVEK